MVESQEFVNMGLPEGTGKRYSKEDLASFYEACPQLPPERIFIQNYALEYSNLSQLPFGRRKQAAVRILEELLLQYCAQQIPKEAFLQKGGTKSYVQLPTGTFVSGNPESLAYVRTLLGAVDVTTERVAEQTRQLKPILDKVRIGKILKNILKKRKI